jgi:ketosteroid isomerase-like protein
MTTAAKTEKKRITALSKAWAAAVRRHDLPAILAHHEPAHRHV